MKTVWKRPFFRFDIVRITVRIKMLHPTNGGNSSQPHRIFRRWKLHTKKFQKHSKRSLDGISGKTLMEEKSPFRQPWTCSLRSPMTLQLGRLLRSRKRLIADYRSPRKTSALRLNWVRKTASRRWQASISTTVSCQEGWCSRGHLMFGKSSVLIATLKYLPAEQVLRLWW